MRKWLFASASEMAKAARLGEITVSQLVEGVVRQT